MHEGAQIDQCTLVDRRVGARLIFGKWLWSGVHQNIPGSCATEESKSIDEALGSAHSKLQSLAILIAYLLAILSDPATHCLTALKQHFRSAASGRSPGRAKRAARSLAESCAPSRSLARKEMACSRMGEGPAWCAAAHKAQAQASMLQDVGRARHTCCRIYNLREGHMKSRECARLARPG
ncbi:hypothetical protein NSU_1123 [Novosphingobium pentaromativorans US6-1]|uniref:Uncharacterized protein n=1 Tax=Novosphingobium pentaromativorans US6-1 TaxID=1088721 RepID=G6E9V2_9SPHN|nr:hypothetical protein NSU_1123 [Novosphingobium pentaromativorans US6-1]